MRVFVLCIIIWLVRYVSSTGSSRNWISTWTNNSRIHGNLHSFSRAYFGRGDVAYMIADISEVTQDQIKDIYQKLSSTQFNIMTRVLY
jgi:hypothetical protein